ncbi:MAG: hypothetical protein WAL50_19170 [Kineosporiaceae bacterium]
MLSALPMSSLAVGDDPRGFGPGWLGFLVLFLMAVATYLLIRSMTGHLRKVRYSPDPAAPEAADAPDAAPPAGEGRPGA